jgi:signal transduction histidine kinase
MRLSAFIWENMEPILQEWEDFARALGTVTESMDAKALRDHAKQILREVAADLETYQTEAQQEAKSKGNAPPTPSVTLDSGAERHGDVRATEGFTLEQMLSEYRALRASVLRLWTKKGGIDDSSEAEQVTRFNEAIDEALAESAKRYSRDVERLIAAAYAKERMAALGTLSAGLGHDMSNVLMPMRVSLDQLEHTGLPPESAPMVDSLRRSMEHLRGLTRGLRSLSVDPEDTEASPATTQLDAWWAEATSYKWALSPAVTLHASGLESLALPAVAVPKHVLMQAVFNLVQNAAEAISAQNGGGGGNIWVSATAGEDGTTVSLVVRDDGPGMDPQALARCTEPFFTTKPRGRGTGLGLSLVRTALERHGGRLVIESAPNKGSAFTLVLPVAGCSDQSHRVRQAIVTVADARVRAIAAALLSGVGVEVVRRPTNGAAVGPDGERATSRGFLWVADKSVDPLDVLRFLDEGGSNVRVVVLGSWVPMDPGSAGEAAAHDGRLIQIADAPSHAALQAALRRAVIGWAP